MGFGKSPSFVQGHPNRSSVSFLLLRIKETPRPMTSIALLPPSKRIQRPDRASRKRCSKKRRRKKTGTKKREETRRVLQRLTIPTWIPAPAANNPRINQSFPFPPPLSTPPCPEIFTSPIASSTPGINTAQTWTLKLANHHALLLAPKWCPR